MKSHLRVNPILFAIIVLISCGTEQKSTSNDRVIRSDINADQTNEFNQKVAGSWSNNANDDSIEGYSFDPSTMGLTGTRGYFCNDASGEVPYELTSRRSFENDDTPWVGWVMQDHFFKDRSMYFVVCHADVAKPKEIFIYTYEFNSVDDCFGLEAKNLQPFKPRT